MTTRATVNVVIYVTRDLSVWIVTGCTSQTPFAFREAPGLKKSHGLKSDIANVVWRYFRTRFGVSEAMAAATHFDFLAGRLLSEAHVFILLVVLHRSHVLAPWTVTVLASNVWSEVLDLLPHDLALRRVAADTGCQLVASQNLSKVFDFLLRYLDAVSGC